VALEVVGLLGPTASGKSSLALGLVHELAEIGIRAEIVNGDAMQIYRGMDIGTAKVSPETRFKVPHHLIDIVEPEEEFTAEEFKRKFDETLQDLASRQTLPILVGGSMFYISSALDHFDFSPTSAALRDELEQKLTLEGPESLIRQLREIDPEAAENIPPGNLRRTIRAIEVNLLTGQPYRFQLPAPTFRRPTMQFGIEVPRDVLVERIDSRVRSMWQEGLVQEVRGLLEREVSFGRTAAAAIGYNQALSQISGRLTQDEAISETQVLTRRYARRQMSWFRRDKRTHWLQRPDAKVIAEQIRLSL